MDAGTGGGTSNRRFGVVMGCVKSLARPHNSFEIRLLRSPCCVPPRYGLQTNGIRQSTGTCLDIAFSQLAQCA